MRYNAITAFVLILAGMVLLEAFTARGEKMTTGGSEQAFAPNVDTETGAIRVPENYREWPVLGTWSLANTDEHPGAREFHVVYTQPKTIAYHRRTGRYPDGAVLVKELLNTKTMSMTTGPAVSHATEITGWFILVRDTKGRYKNTGLWGDGWGWALFTKDDPERTVSKSYRRECIPCHTPARQLAASTANDSDKWTYSFGYPVLRQ